MIREHRAAALGAVALGGIGGPQRVGHRDGDRALMQPRGALAQLGSGSQQPRLPGEAQHPLARRVHAALAAQAGPHLAMALTDKRAVGQHPADRRQQLCVGHRADGAGSPPRRL
jgi:hypothetical protein